MIVRMICADLTWTDMLLVANTGKWIVQLRRSSHGVVPTDTSNQWSVVWDFYNVLFDEGWHDIAQWENNQL